ncbi:MAG TPA: hypothetical protein VK578_02290 [Edaphobacter sp.]|nr:hypothetical protein [Edaphobacter sp.]
MNRHPPPPFACWIIEYVLPVPYREPMLGDLIEEYALLLESRSYFAATRWFWGQTCRSVPYLAWFYLRSGRWLMSLSTAIGVYIFMGMLKVSADLMISKIIAPQQMMHVVLAPIVFLATTATGGLVATRIRRGAAIFLALIVLITVAILIELRVCTVAVPQWYQFGFLILGPLTVLITPAIFWRLKSRAE